MNHRMVFLRYYTLSKLRARHTSHNRIRTYLTNYEIFPGISVLSSEEANSQISTLILSGKPFMAGRFGANELSTVRMFDFEVSQKYDKVMQQMYLGAGVFPPTNEVGRKFTELMLKSIPEVTLMGIWLQPFEDYYLKKYGNKNLEMTYLLDLEPWGAPKNPWTSALKGKKVLVIHPFTETIQSQYARREKIFPGTEILPDFELKTLKAVQTVAGEQDERFATWFDALEWMYKEAIEIDFDIAIIGCGAYGFPLAVKLKQAGKQAIHLAGATQLLFGIKGKRWEENDAFAYVQKYFNDAWVYPDADDRPKQAEKVEGGCYW